MWECSMSQIQVNLPDELHEILNEVASRLNKTPEESIELALNFFLQMDTIDCAIIGKERFDANAELVPLAVDGEDDDLEYELKFHPEALEEYEALDEEQQMLAICALVTRLFDEEDEESDVSQTPPELDLYSTEDTDLILSHFSFGDIVYAVNSDAVAIYHVSFNEEDALDDDDIDDDDEDEDDEDDADFEADFSEEELTAIIEED